MGALDAARLRIDQVMMTCLQYLLPISCVLLLGVSCWQSLLVKLPWIGNIRYLLAARQLARVDRICVQGIRQRSGGQSDPAHARPVATRPWRGARRGSERLRPSWKLKFLFFLVLAVLTCGSALAVVLSQNIVRAAAWLLFTLAGVAGIYFLIGADFVGGHPADRLCRRHSGAGRVRRHAHRSGAIRLHEDRAGGLGHGRRRRAGAPDVSGGLDHRHILVDAMTRSS